MNTKSVTVVAHVKAQPGKESQVRREPFAASHVPSKARTSLSSRVGRATGLGDETVRRPQACSSFQKDLYFGSHFSQFFAKASTFSFVTGVSGVSSRGRGGSFLKW